MSWTKKIKKEALKLSNMAVGKLFEDEKRAMKIAAAMGSVQRSKQAFDRGQQQLMRQLQLAPKSDFKALGKQLSSLKRRVRELDEKLDRLQSNG